MKKVFLTAVALATFGYSQAQDKTSTQVTFGAKAGVNFANLSGENDFGSNESITSFHIGGFVNIPFGEKFSLQPELLYAGQGSTEEVTITNSYSRKNTIKNAYLNLPIMVQYKLMDKLFVEAGPQVGLFLSNTTDFELYTYFDNKTVSSSDSRNDYYNTIDFGFNVGAGYFITDNFFANVRYNLGLSKVFVEDLDSDAKNRVLQLSIGYSF